MAGAKTDDMEQFAAVTEVDKVSGFLDFMSYVLGWRDGHAPDLIGLGMSRSYIMSYVCTRPGCPASDRKPLTSFS